MKLLNYILLFAFSPLLVLGQAEEQEKLEVSGYLKFLSSFSQTNDAFVPEFLRPLVPTSYQDYQFHNRFDARYFFNEHWTAGAGMRNRLFWGYQVRQGDNFLRNLDNDRGFFDLSYLYWESEDAVLHTIFDRAWLKWESQKVMVRLGRQRVNWGVNTVWNPNDIFNQYNYFDFDYEERPGADALRIQYFPNFNNTLELAWSPARELEQSTAALLYKTNRWNYDFQFLSGYYRKDAVFGLGWAGSIGTAGFKGEASYYLPLTSQTESALLSSVSADYAFTNGTYVMLSYLYNGSANGDAQLLDFSQLTAGQVQSPKNIFIFKHTSFASASFNITPLFTGSFACMITPDFENLILYPSLSYSLDENLDLLLACQFFASQNPLRNDEFDWLAAATFLRLKWSF